MAKSVKSIVSSLDGSTSEETWQKLISLVESSTINSEVSASQHYATLLKVNSIYEKLSDVTHADTLIRSCFRNLTTGWSYLSNKYLHSTATLLSHLFSKTLTMGSHSTYTSCCELLIFIIPRIEGLKDQEQLSLTGYCYKSLWNRWTSANNQRCPCIETVFKERLMALRLASIGSWEKQACKIAHQISVAVTACSKARNSREIIQQGLSKLKEDVDRSTVVSDEQSALWCHLSLFINCMQALYSVDYGMEIEVKPNVGEHAELCRAILQQYQAMSKRQLIDTRPLQGVEPLLSSATNPIELEATSVLLNAASKFINSDFYQTCSWEILLSWVDLLEADVYINRKFVELEGKIRGNYFLSRELCSCLKLVYMTADILTRWYGDEQAMTSLLKTNARMIGSLLPRETGCESQSFVPLASYVSRILHLLRHSDNIEVVMAAKDLAQSAIQVLLNIGCLEETKALRKQLCESLLKQSAFSDALDVFTLFQNLPKQHWDGLVTDWSRIKRKAADVASTAVMSRVMGVELFGQLSNKDDVIYLIFKEFRETGIKESNYNQLKVLLGEMRARAVSKVHRALYYLCQTELHVSLDKDIPFAQQCVDKGLQQLKDNVATYSNDLTAQFYMWKYVIGYRNCCSLANINDALTVTGYEATVCTVQSRNIAQEPLDKAIKLWTLSKASSLYSEQMTCQCLHIICCTFYLSRNLNQMLSVCSIARDLLAPSTFNQSIALLHVEALILLGDITRATEMLSKITEESDELTLLRVKLIVHRGDKVEEAVELLESIMVRQSKAMTMNEAYRTASAHRLLLDLLIRNPGLKTKRDMSMHAWQCQREHSLLFASMTTYPVQGYGLKLQYLDAILTSYITLGNVNLYVGSVRECVCFLQATLNVCRLLLLPYREADISTTWARLECFLDDTVAAEARLRHAHTILTSQITFMAPKADEQINVTPKMTTLKVAGPTKDRLSSLKKADLFGFVSEEEEGGGDSFTIKGPDMSNDEDDEYKVPSYKKGPEDVTGSPSLNNKIKFGENFTNWGPYQHVKSCKCDSCTDFSLQVTHLSMLDTLGVYRLKSGLTEEAIHLARTCLTCCQAVAARSAVQDVNSSAQLVTCQLHFLTTIMKGLLALGSYSDMIKEWRNVELLNITSYHTLAMCQLKYLQCLPRIIQYYKIYTQKTSPKPNPVVIEADNMSSPLQPISTNKSSVHPAGRSTLAKAPRKTRTTARSKVQQLAFDDSDTEETPARSSRKSTRVPKLAKPKPPRFSSLPPATSPLAVTFTKPMSTKKEPFTVFCDEESVEQKKRSSRQRRNEDQDSLEGIRSSRSGRRTRTANRETVRSHSADDADSIDMDLFSLPFSPVNEVFSPLSPHQDEGRQPLPPLSAHQSDAMAYLDDIEIMRGDKASSTRATSKDSNTETMRCAIPSDYHSPLEVVTSPTQEHLTPFSAQTAADRQKLISDVTAIWEKIHSKPPYPLYKVICQSLAILHYKQSNSWLAAFYLMETQAITFSYKCNLAYAQKQHQRMKESNTTHHKPLIQFPTSRSVQDLKRAVNSLPIGCVVCSVSVVNVPETGLQQLYLTRMEKNQEPVVLLATDMPFPQEMWKELNAILEANNKSMEETRKSFWWEMRRSIDARLKLLLSKMQEELGVARTMLMGCYSDTKSRLVVEKCVERIKRKLSPTDTPISHSLIRMLVNGASSVTMEELNQFFLKQYPSLSKDCCLNTADLIMDGVRVLMDSREPLIICLDKGAHSICWESMPYISECPITRMPSIYTIESCLGSLTGSNSVYPADLDSDNVYYILNPADNLPSTESIFKPILSSRKTWKGIVGMKPTAEQYKKGLSDHDLFIFLGHGSGSNYLRPRDLCKLDCEAAVMLMGCSSGAFDSRGEMESAGITHDYHIANCPSVMACLWDVTDKDIDRYTKNLLNGWLLAGDENSPHLLDHMPAARRACKLQYLVGCATVAYGLPVSRKVTK